MRIVLGCMTGTSLDALDVAAVAIKGRGLECRARLLASHTEPLEDLRDPLRSLSAGVPMDAGAIARLARALGELHAEACRRVARNAGRCDLVCAHGQTVHHTGGATWQLLDPWPIVHALECPVVSDLRRADMASGGEGAPITPLADWVLFRSADESRVIVNLGGFCNTTRLPAGGTIEEIRGGDVCACNQILDHAARRVLGAPYDKDGARASDGVTSDEATNELAKQLRAQAKSGRSLGTGDEGGAWVDAWRERLEPDDLLASAAAAIGRVIGESIGKTSRVLVAGGGARNAALVAALADSCGVPVEPADDHGVPAHLREAVCMAVLGACCADGVAITLPKVTGRRDRPLLHGAWINAPVAIPEAGDDA
ncbi:MAG: anhydro-N-acetylmuramic acid kinase [Phycisphaerales bacterium]